MARINMLTGIEESSFNIAAAPGPFPINWKPNPAFTKAYGVTPYLDSPTVWVMDLVNGTTTTFTLPGSGQRGAAIAYNVDGSKVYITDNENQTVYVYDTSTDAQIGGGIAIGAAPHSNILRPGSNQIWIVNSADPTLAVIDTVTDSVIHTYSIAGEGDGLVFSPDGSIAYVGIPNGIELLNANTGAHIDTIPVATYTPTVMKVNAAGTKLYASYPVDSVIQVFDLNANVLEDTIPVSNGVWGLAFNDDETRLYAAAPNLGGGLSGTDISVIDTATNTITGTITPGGGAPFFIYSSPIESASTSITLSGNSNTDLVLAETGESRTPIMAASVMLAVLASLAIIKQRFYRSLKF